MINQQRANQPASIPRLCNYCECPSVCSTIEVRPTTKLIMLPSLIGRQRLFECTTVYLHVFRDSCIGITSLRSQMTSTDFLLHTGQFLIDQLLQFSVQCLQRWLLNLTLVDRHLPFHHATHVILPGSACQRRRRREVRWRCANGRLLTYKLPITIHFSQTLSSQLSSRINQIFQMIFWIKHHRACPSDQRCVYGITVYKSSAIFDFSIMADLAFQNLSVSGTVTVWGNLPICYLRLLAARLPAAKCPQRNTEKHGWLTLTLFLTQQALDQDKLINDCRIKRTVQRTYIWKRIVNEHFLIKKHDAE